MPDQAETPRQAEWTKPGPGAWELDASHSSGSPTRLIRRTFPITISEGYREVFARFGGPLETLECEFVHGKMYRRPKPLVGGDSDGKTPPAPVLWLATRLHPAFRKANKLAAKTVETKAFLNVLDHWEQTERFEWIEKNTALQNIDMATLDDAALADHLEVLDAHLVTGFTRHHVLHGSDLGPIGDLLVHAKEWGLDQIETMTALRGRSPATVEASVLLDGIAGALRKAGTSPDQIGTLDDVTAVSSEAGELLKDYLALYGARIVSRYDIEGLTAAEMPGTIVALLRQKLAAAPTTVLDEGIAAANTAAASLRAAVPVDQRDEFDEMLDSARRAYGLRDDNGPLTGEWPLGLVRYGFLETGRRLASAGHLAQPVDVFELDTPELASLLRKNPGPDLVEIDRRKAEREWEEGLEPPTVLGEISEMPPSWVFPPALRRMADVVVEAISLLEPDDRDGDRVPMTGIGIGDETYVGRARVAHAPEDVLSTLEAGDVLVAAFTAPTYNAVLALAGAVVVQEGGLLCHAAVLARELGIPAVIGASDAMTTIADGDIIEVNATTGVVRVVE